ncbi:Lrp/AsnC family transcriptional regulator [Paenibacillus sp. MWE-103]|uniref:Lrp/AsnC family transcriptional regulator n=1 Tax=Paenibacillus artemisiicola TaxID=1172618 RepID=A0ABS3WJQ5_9BACL|nr:Lrp/AsnC family transcriptional regulator [Paenibacillus artemisiicola]MBO7748566.1 Lrp/AsnC family transcriptional regulator [Paenibacillus artemisiicola]
MTHRTFDDTDRRIVACLLEDAARSNKDIGAAVHLTGQAVGARIRRLRELGVIEGYTLRWNPDKLGLAVQAFITMFLPSNSAHAALIAFAREREEIAEMHRVSGEGCYWLRVRVNGGAELNALLGELLAFGNYKVSLSIETVKSG